MLNVRERYELIMRDYEAITPTTLQTFISEQPAIDSDKRRASGTKIKICRNKTIYMDQELTAAARGILYNCH